MNKIKKINKVIGICLSNIKKEKLGMNDIEKYGLERGIIFIDFLKNDISKISDTLKKNNHIDIEYVLIKVKDAFTPEQKKMALYTLNYCVDNNIKLVDNIKSQKMLNDREYMAHIFTNLVKEINSPHLIFPKTCIGDNINEIKEQMKKNKITYPIICKPRNDACCNNFHGMTIISNENSMDKFDPSNNIIQQFHDHGGIIYKIYVINNKYQVVVKSSIDNYQNNNNSKDIIKFNTSDIKLDEISEDKLCHNNILPSTPPDFLDKLTRKLSEMFDITIYGYDLIRLFGTDIYAIIDINYFPGFVGFQNFKKHFCDSILENDLNIK